MDDPFREPQIRSLLVLAAAGVAAGVALSVLKLPEVAAPLTVGSLVTLIYAVHAFGRSGPDRTRSRRRRRANS